MKRKFLCFIPFLFIGFLAQGQPDFDQKALDYIHEYKNIAIAEQLRSGVPAAITLAQGIFETSAGNSELCTKANNHFGIKCKNNWTGATYAYTDDAKDECFRKYENAFQSYKDHSDFLKNNQRYAALFLLEPTDYTEWAKGLKKCGYATNPLYAAKIIGFIEKYHLEAYTDMALKEKGAKTMLAQSDAGRPDRETITATQTATSTFENLGYTGRQEHADTPAQNKDQNIRYYVTTEKNGLKGFYAKKGDLLLEYAIKHRIRYSKLLTWNDLPDRPLPADLFIYLAPKRKTGAHATHTVKAGESLLKISQEEAIQLEQLRIFNKLKIGEEPAAGTLLSLQEPNTEKPVVYEAVKTAQPQQKAVVSQQKEEDQYVSIDHTQPESYAADLTEGDVDDAMEKTESSRAEKNVPVMQTDIKSAAPLDNTEQPVAIPVQDQHKTNAPVKEAAVPSKPLTPLEKLKAYMDKVVYADEQSADSAVTEEPDNDPTEQNNDQVPSQNTLPARTLSKRKTTSAQRPVNSSAPSFYTVKKGDTAFGIAQKYHISLAQLRAWNHLPKSMEIVVGQKLKVRD